MSTTISQNYLNSAAELNYLIESAEKSYGSGDLYTALEFLKKVIKLSPGMTNIYFTMAVIYKKLKNYNESEKYYKTAIQNNPSFFEAYYNLGILYHESEQYSKAVECFSMSGQLNNSWHLAYYNLGNSLRELEKFEEAVEAYSNSIKINPAHASSYYNRGVVQEKLLNFESALTDYQYAMKIEPEHVDAHWNSSLILLAKGDYRNGFREYEWRLKTKENVKRVFAKPRLINQDITGKRIFIYSEQGFGDALQFVRYVDLLRKKGAYTTLECDPKLYDLFTEAKCADQIVGRKSFSEPETDYNYYISMMSLPYYFSTTFETIPAQDKYLNISNEKIEKWKDILGESTGKKVGLFWQGNTHNLKGKERSCPVELLKNITEIPAHTFYSLQVDGSNKDIDEKGLKINTLHEKGMTDFTDTAAVIENLDLVITIDSAVAHLAGALGINTWLLLHYNPDWRWSGSPTDSAWYPSIRLFRQSEKNNWINVLESVQSELLKNFI